MEKYSISFLNSIRHALIESNLIKNNSKYLLAISGGQDSICLLIIIFVLKKQFKINIHILFCNHLWQKENFYVFIQILKICFFLKIKISQSISTIYLLNEKTSRLWRINNFLRFVHFFKNKAILTGHSLNDQNETFFFNLLRGSGLMGVISLQKERNFNNFNKIKFFSKNDFRVFIKTRKSFLEKNFILLNKKKKITKIIFTLEKKNNSNYSFFRPLISKTRNELKKFFFLLKLPLFPDKTNQYLNFSRNRIRKQFIPTIRFFFNPQINYSISRFITIYFENEKENIENINRIYSFIFYENKNFFFINFYLLEKLPQSTQKKLLIFFLKNKLSIYLKYSSFTKFFRKIKIYFSSKKIDKKKYYFSFLMPEIGLIYFNQNYIYILK